MVFSKQARSPTEIARDILSAMDETEAAERNDKLDELAREAVHLPSRHAVELYQQLVQLSSGRKRTKD